jgi:hypothetical protein
MAAMPEAQEETGLAHLAFERYPGEHVRDMSDFGKHEMHHHSLYNQSREERASAKTPTFLTR